MPADVDPKKSRKRSNDGGGFFSTIPGISSGKFYLKQLGYLALVIVVLTVIYDFSLFIHNNPLYKAQITVSGLEKLEKNAVTNVLSTGYPQDGSVSLTEISVGEVKEALETSLPRLKNIRVMKDYPNQLIVTVEERQPVALLARVGENDERIYLPVGIGGTIFRPTAGEIRSLPNVLPVVKGLETVDPKTETYKRKWRRARNVLNAIEQELSKNRVDWLQLRTGGYAVIQVNRPKTLKVRLGVGQYTQKLTKLREMMQTEQFMTIERYVNLSDLNNVRVL